MIKEEFEKQSEETWNSLTKEKQLDVFCFIMNKLYQGELVDKGTFRYILYDIFKFDHSAYVPAYMSGFGALHNAIIDEDHVIHLMDKIKKFAKDNDISEEKISEFEMEFLREFI